MKVKVIEKKKKYVVKLNGKVAAHFRKVPNTPDGEEGHQSELHSHNLGVERACCHLGEPYREKWVFRDGITSTVVDYKGKR